MAESDRRSYRDSAVGRSSETPRAQADDPLAELARLIGQSVPMDRAAGQDRRSTARAADAAQDEVVGEPRDDYYSAPDESRYEDFNERYELANEKRYDRSVHADPPPFTRSSRHDQEADFAAAAAHKLHDFIGDDRDGTAYNEAEAPSSDPGDDRYGDEYNDEAHDHSDDHADGEEYEDYNEGLNTRRRGGFVLVVMIFGLAVLGAAGVFAYRAMFGGPMLPTLPPIIKAEGGPNKIMPGDGNSPANASRQTDSNTETAASGERLVPREERPVEMPAPANPAPRSVSTVPIFPDPPSAGGPGAVVGFPALAPSNNPASSTQPPTTVRPGIPTAPSPAVTSAAASSAATSAPLASMSSPASTPTVPGAPSPKKIRTVSIHTEQPNAADPTTGSATPTRPSAQAHDANEPLSIVPSSTDSPTATTRPRTIPAQPVPLNKPPANETASAVPVAAAGSYTVQVSSQRSEDEAQSSFRDLQAKYPDLLGGRTPIIRRADLGAKGIYYRAMVGPFASADQATELCSNLKAAGGSCLVQKN